MTKLFLCFFAFVSLTGCTTLDMERTHLVENGMTQAEVLDAVGIPPTQVLTTADYTTYLWRDRTFYGNYRSFVVMFDKSGMVVGKDDRTQRL
ncbi:MAG: outer membrane protein assembly factor BamE, partial [Sutterellaceae bacterium]|nr:outer membrane protein assembly factor BamE [Sutterellaceae bacterium]